MEKLNAVQASQCVVVKEGSQVAEARRKAQSMVSACGWDETAAGKLAIAVSEAATNLLHHGGGGEIVLSLYAEGSSTTVELLALDKGAGMVAVSENMEDGVSSRGTYGEGLGAIRRLSSDFDIYSCLGLGTALMARFTFPERDLRAAQTTWKVGAVRIPYPGESVCGDHWAAKEQDGRLLVMVADGLGHGLDASRASQAAMASFLDSTDTDPVPLIEKAHLATKHTRGAAAAVAVVLPSNRQVKFAGVGNISAAVFTAGIPRHMVSHNGTIGQNRIKTQEFTYDWSLGSTLVMHSDGITTSWNASVYPGIFQRHPSLLAGLLYRDASRGRDDVCSVVARAS